MSNFNRFLEELPNLPKERAIELAKEHLDNGTFTFDYLLHSEDRLLINELNDEIMDYFFDDSETDFTHQQISSIARRIDNIDHNAYALVNLDSRFVSYLTRFDDPNIISACVSEMGYTNSLYNFLESEDDELVGEEWFDILCTRKKLLFLLFSNTDFYYGSWVYKYIGELKLDFNIALAVIKTDIDMVSSLPDIFLRNKSMFKMARLETVRCIKFFDEKIITEYLKYYPLALNYLSADQQGDIRFVSPAIGHDLNYLQYSKMALSRDIVKRIMDNTFDTDYLKIQKRK